ncbi:hypothetical protein ASPCAL14084 [Aspergillus calidoustus]|uniref:DUF4291 domain protein n=1 Tax=Aspergillus calidoustus TaxID=454130 RepID=A0A0U5GEX8_ASPCI|nr:hypothetical protein ASPCAL14084 [Aspergillus calidoustus]
MSTAADSASTARPKTKQQSNNMTNPENPPYRQIRALYTPQTITIYQAYPPSIALPALATQSLSRVPTFKRTRMTWIKPSFLWMAYRSGYATKQNQEHVLAIEISRPGFEWALGHAVLSHIPGSASEDELKRWKNAVEDSCVRVQWDPERDVHGNPLAYRSLQVGLRGEAVERFVKGWIVGIKDVTGVMHDVKERVEKGDLEGAEKLVPVEKVYTLPEGVASGLGMV